VFSHMLVAIRPEKEFGKWLIRLERKTTNGSRGYLPSRSAKELLQAEGDEQVDQAF
jgi:hypothetical protein